MQQKGTAKPTPLSMTKVDGIVKCFKRNGVRFSVSWFEMRRLISSVVRGGLGARKGE